MSSEGLRHRKKQSEEIATKKEEEENAQIVQCAQTPLLEKGTFWLTRVVILRATAFIYFIAFLVALHQNEALIGHDGLLPADKYLSDAEKRLGGSAWTRFLSMPTLLWMVDYRSDIDYYLNAMAYAGLTLSGAVILLGAANVPLMLLLWLLYHSIVNVGQRWYSFGWESQILETGFLATFLCPWLSCRRFPPGTPTPRTVIWLFIWLIFRIMLGAGLIKIRGDKCWRDLTCMNYHYQTQPVPNPISYYMHNEPEVFHQFETLVNHFVELLAPFFLLMGRRMRMIGGSVQIIFQVIIIISGNLSFLNWLTIIPSLACFDDHSLAWLFPSARKEICSLQRKKPFNWRSNLGHVFNVSFGLLLAYLSVPIVQNLLSHRQIMNTSFDSFRIVNTYGAFGSITKERTEVVFQGTHSLEPNAPNAEWKDYEFKCKPGNITRRPCLISPYHYRLDWLMWFAAFQQYQQNPWLIHLAAKFLMNDEGANSLIAFNPFEDTDPPTFVRAEHYRYVFSKFGSNTGAWWKRRRIGNYLPAVSLAQLEGIMQQMGWKTIKK
ncbi:hypothetical protein CAPTEDRAFT_179420 [Capitella teleta]|uniref:Lipase maturation factor n=1 Tax=Capitella teleta TaxID=283909 RepID=R7U8Y8_CAPTE|nr:hypothetical protein CAPTEDRAFT_179420 [Capitella teleta]|eukprot:ELU02414.1 hypothetical protein CAPTEDRAFT_179420 [Capitella teleta]